MISASVQGRSATYVHATSLSYAVDGQMILNNVSCSFAAPSVAIIGTNGSGKSSFLRILDGLERTTSGTLNVLNLDPSRQAKRLHTKVGFVFTNPDTQIIMPTVAEDIAFSLHDTSLSREEKQERVDAQLAHFSLTPYANQPAHSLSGGQKQMLALASMLIREPELLLADEPTTMLDLPNARRISHELLHNPDRPVIIATHDLALASQCEQAVHFHNGTIVESGASDAVIRHYIAFCSSLDETSTQVHRR